MKKIENRQRRLLVAAELARKVAISLVKNYQFYHQDILFLKGRLAYKLMKKWDKNCRGRKAMISSLRYLVSKYLPSKSQELFLTPPP